MCTGFTFATRASARGKCVLSRSSTASSNLLQKLTIVAAVASLIKRCGLGTDAFAPCFSLMGASSNSCARADDSWSRTASASALPPPPLFSNCKARSNDGSGRSGEYRDHNGHMSTWFRTLRRLQCTFVQGVEYVRMRDIHSLHDIAF